MSLLKQDGTLTGQAVGQLGSLLASYLLSPARGAQFLTTRLDASWFDYDQGAGLSHTAFTLVQQFNAENRWRDLLQAALDAAPSHPGLLAFAEQVGLSARNVATTQGQGPVPVQGRQLELKIKAAASTFDVAVWRAKLGEIEGRVCRIEYPQLSARGTGFLIGEDLVLTNYHVIEKLKTGAISPANVVLRFDYKVSESGVEVRKGQTYRLAENWEVLSSPYSQQDISIAPVGEPTADELDFAILRVAGTPGSDPVGGPTDDPVSSARGWLKAAVPYDFEPATALYIVQHPDGKPMQVAIDSEAVLSLNGSGTRVRYTTMTEPGSSGSPVFGPNWEWVALHHAGDPKYRHLFEAPEFNQGIPLQALLAHIAARGMQDLIETM